MAWQNCIRIINSFVDIWLVLWKDLTTVKIQWGLTYLKIQPFQVQDIKKISNLIWPSDSVVSNYRGTLRLRFEPIWLSYFQSLLSDWYHSPLSPWFWTFLFFQWKTMNVQNKSDIGEWYQFRFLTNWRHLIKIGNNLIR